jgi:membrane protein implicated in regulation of membrane protease activity
MAWWGWLSVGIFLLGAELLGVDAAFYLIFVGSAAIAVGLLGMFGLVMPVWAQWLLFSVLALTSMVMFREKVYKRLRGGAPGFGNTLIGEIVEAPGAILPGGQARVSLRGSMWTAVNTDEQTIPAGARATVVAAEGMTLMIQSLPGSSSQPDA